MILNFDGNNKDIIVYYNLLNKRKDIVDSPAPVATNTPAVNTLSATVPARNAPSGAFFAPISPVWSPILFSCIVRSLLISTRVLDSR